MFDEFGGDESGAKFMATAILHEIVHTHQIGGSSAKIIDKEYQAYLYQELAAHLLGVYHPISLGNRVALRNGTYKRSV